MNAVKSSTLKLRHPVRLLIYSYPKVSALLIMSFHCAVPALNVQPAIKIMLSISSFLLDAYDVLVGFLFASTAPNWSGIGTC